MLDPMLQAAWARRLRVRGLASLASARRSTAAGAKISRSSPARLMCQLMQGAISSRGNGRS
ncbi:MAG: hypothetical protein M0Q93_06920, partial [Terrimicrobiaceae bacterium]|nr:hypothetical protein [Terrimicrobiaceae bacterium]